MLSTQSGFMARSTLLAALFLTLCLAVSSLGLAPHARAAEKILHYDVTATVNKDASMSVKERITVNVEGAKIKRGIFRHFPVVYPTTWGTTHITGFELGQVLLDGSHVPCKQERQGDSVLLMIGDPNKTVRHGEHTYEINFTITGHLRFLDDMDALYYNVTGNEWDFPIENASFTLILPPGAEENILAKNAYTGRMNETGKDFTSEGQTVFRTTKTLYPGEGLTVAFDWKKGFVDKPDPAAAQTDDDPGIDPELAQSVQGPSSIHQLVSGGADIPSILRLLIPPLACLICFLLLWRIFGKDPLPGPIVPIFHPPAGMTPGYAAFLKDHTATSNTFSGDLMKLATDGYVRFQNTDAQNAKDDFILIRTEKQPAPDLPATLSNILDKVFGSSRTSVNSGEKQGKEALGDAYERNSSAYSSLLGKLRTLNIMPSLLGLAICGFLIWLLMPLAVTGMFGWHVAKYFWLFYCPEALFPACLVGSILAGIGLLVLRVTFSKGGFTVKGLIFGLIFLFAGYICLSDAWHKDSVITLTLLVSILIPVFFVAALMPKKSKDGMHDLEQALGLEMFIATAEEKRLAVVNAPQDSVEVFETLLPYAIAFGLADAWEKRFANILAAANYQPAWQDGNTWRTRGFQTAAYGLTSAAREVATARAAARAAAARSKGSSWSGGSGTSGGSSGRGSGGGGGGGW